jgi:hypothetical protein
LSAFNRQRNWKPPELLKKPNPPALTKVSIEPAFNPDAENGLATRDDNTNPLLKLAGVAGSASRTYGGTVNDPALAATLQTATLPISGCAVSGSGVPQLSDWIVVIGFSFENNRKLLKVREPPVGYFHRSL